MQLKNTECIIVSDTCSTECMKFKTGGSQILPELKLELELFLSCIPYCSWHTWNQRYKKHLWDFPFLQRSKPSAMLLTLHK